MTECWASQAGPGLSDIGAAGVLRSHRRRGDRGGAEACARLSARRRRWIRELCNWNTLGNGAILGSKQAAELCARTSPYCVREGGGDGASGGWWIEGESADLLL